MFEGAVALLTHATNKTLQGCQRSRRRDVESSPSQESMSDDVRRGDASSRRESAEACGEDSGKAVRSRVGTDIQDDDAREHEGL